MSRSGFDRMTSFNHYRAIACDMYYRGLSVEAIIRCLYGYSEIGRIEHYLRENEHVLAREREERRRQAQLRTSRQQLERT